MSLSTATTESGPAASGGKRRAGTAAGSEPSPDSGLGAWIERHEEELRRHLVRMLGGEPDAEDVLQEVWLTAHRKPPDDGPGSNVRAWLYRVATNAALDRLAGERRRRHLLAARPPELIADARPAPDAFLGELDGAARERVRASVAALPRKQREAVWLRWAEGVDYETIARTLDSSPESARANVYQGMKKLREQLCDIWKKEKTG